jgi:hypothetical protein
MDNLQTVLTTLSFRVLGEGADWRWRTREEREGAEKIGAEDRRGVRNRAYGRGNVQHDGLCDDLGDDVRGGAKRAIGVRGLTAGVRVYDLERGAEDDQSNAQDAEENLPATAPYEI